jgi:uncharacterized small protein (DUF1192 family)
MAVNSWNSGPLEGLFGIGQFRFALIDTFMDEEAPRQPQDFALASLGKQDLYTLSVADLKERIESLRAEIERCEAALAKRGDTRSAAEKLFRL